MLEMPQLILITFRFSVSLLSLSVCQQGYTKTYFPVTNEDASPFNLEGFFFFSPQHCEIG